MKTVTVHEAKTHLSRYLAEVEEGEEIVIARRDQPVARLVAAKPAKVDRSGFIGCLKGYVSEEVVDYLTDPELDRQIEEDFMRSADAPLPSQEED